MRVVRGTPTSNLGRATWLWSYGFVPGPIRRESLEPADTAKEQT
jgi:hypothetical protein